MASPQFIPLKKGKECLAVMSWRDSPSSKPAQPPTSPPPPQPDDKKRRRTKSRGPEENFDDFILKCVVPQAKLSDVEQHLISFDLKPMRTMDIGMPRTVPLKRLDGDEGEHCVKESPLIFAESNDETLPPIALPPNASACALEDGHLFCLLFAEHEIATKVANVIMTKWPSSSTEIVSRRRATLNASLVIKGLPFTTKCDKLVEELERLTFKPSYVRLHRGERGVFKCVVFVKYTNRLIAEHSKLELERLIVGTRPLKVEFKKKCKDELQKPTSMSGLEQAVRDLRFSKDHEGFFYIKSQLSKEDIKYLKYLAGSYDLIFEVSQENVTVKRKIAGEKPSPALRPSTTPQWVPATPGSLLPMDFRGIRHWKEMRQSTSSTMLGIVRPMGPGDTTPFPTGRGRPLN